MFRALARFPQPRVTHLHRDHGMSGFMVGDSFSWQSRTYHFGLVFDALGLIGEAGTLRAEQS